MVLAAAAAIPLRRTAITGFLIAACGAPATVLDIAIATVSTRE